MIFDRFLKTSWKDAHPCLTMCCSAMELNADSTSRNNTRRNNTRNTHNTQRKEKGGEKAFLVSKSPCTRRFLVCEKLGC